MSEKSLVEFIESLDEYQIGSDDKKSKAMEILAGIHKFEANIDSYENVLAFISYIKKNKESPELKGMFKKNIIERALEIEKIIKKIGKKRTEEIIRDSTGSGLKGDEKKLFDFISQTEDVLWQKSYGRTMSPTGTKGNLDAATIAIRSFNIIPVMISIKEKKYYGIMRAPEGIITWEQKIDYFKNMDFSDKEVFDRLIKKHGKEKLKKMSYKKDEIDDVDKLIDQEQKELHRELRDKFSKIKELPWKPVPLIKDNGRYIIEKSHKSVKELKQLYDFKYNDSDKASEKMINTIISIMKENKKYKDSTSKEIANILKKHEVRTWAVNNVKFWKVVRSFF